MNTKTSPMLSILTASWCIYNLVSPGEAMSKALLMMNYAFLASAGVGMMGAFAQIAKGK